MKDTVISLYLYGGAAALAGVLVLIGYGVTWGARKIPWSRGRDAVVTAWDLVAVVTREANAELQARLKLARDPASDGGEAVTAAEWRAARDAAVSKFKRLYSADMIKALAKGLGIELDQVDDWIGTAILGGLKVPTVAPADPP